jgi:hypothetical protein
MDRGLPLGLFLFPEVPQQVAADQTFRKSLLPMKLRLAATRTSEDFSRTEAGGIHLRFPPEESHGRS